MKLSRIAAVESYISEKKVVSIEDLCEHFGVSVNTIRRDLNYLKSQGKIEKIYGGARAANAAETTYDERNIKFPSQKKTIARAAASFVNEGDTIFIDTGTTAISLLEYLEPLKRLTIVTNSIYVMYHCLEYSQFSTVCLPGVLKHSSAAIVGDQCTLAIDSYNINKAFMACTSLSIDSGASNASLEEFTIKKRIMSRSLIRFLLVDHSKFNKSSLLTYARVEDFDYIVTDKNVDETYRSYFDSHGIRLVIASAPEK